MSNRKLISYASFEARQSFPFHLCSGESTARVIDLTARVIDFNKEKILKELEKKLSARPKIIA